MDLNVVVVVFGAVVENEDVVQRDIDRDINIGMNIYICICICIHVIF